MSIRSPWSSCSGCSEGLSAFDARELGRARPLQGSREWNLCTWAGTEVVHLGRLRCRRSKSRMWAHIQAGYLGAYPSRVSGRVFKPGSDAVRGSCGDRTDLCWELARDQERRLR